MFIKRYKDPINPISFLRGEFEDKKQEEAFFQSQLKMQQSGLRLILLLFAVIFLVFIILELISNSGTNTLPLVFITRLLTLAVLVVIYFLLPSLDTKIRYELAIFLLELAIIIFFLTAIFLYRGSDIYMHAFATIILIISFFVVFNSFRAVFTASLLLFFGFLFTSNLSGSSLPLLEKISIVVFILASIILSIVAFSYTGYLRRRQRVLQEQLKSLSITDPLTRAYNRIKFNDELRNEIERSRRYHTPMSIIFFDLDHFKKINDAFGHPAGDLALIKTTRLVRNSIRSVDLLARWGGEEFIILLPDTSLKASAELAERIREKIENYDFAPVGKITCSFGVTDLKADDSVDSLLQRVDDLLYEAKDSGRNCIKSA